MASTEVHEPVLRVTEEARHKIVELREAEPNSDALALWLDVSGESGDTYTYDVYFQPLADAGETNIVQPHDDLPVVLRSADADKLRGATLDVNRDGGMVINNPNRPSALRATERMAPLRAAGAPSGDLSSELAQRVLHVLDQDINPAIASHGGRADLVAVEEDTAYLRLSGGCQGCGMATVTLSQGIEVAIREAVPEIARVVDVTDHASGTNPYFESAKK